MKRLVGGIYLSGLDMKIRIRLRYKLRAHLRYHTRQMVLIHGMRDKGRMFGHGATEVCYLLLRLAAVIGYICTKAIVYKIID